MRKIILIIAMLFTSTILFGCDGKLKINEEMLKERLLNDGICIPGFKTNIIPDEITELKILNREDKVDTYGNKITELELSLATSNKYFDVSGTYIIYVKKHDTLGFKITFNNFENDMVNIVKTQNIPLLDLDKLKTDITEKSSFKEIEEISLLKPIDYTSVQVNENGNLTIETKIQCKGSFDLPYDTSDIVGVFRFSFELVNEEWTVNECLGQ